MSLPMTVLLDVAVRLGASVVVMPGADDVTLLEAARQAHIAVVDDAVVRENLVLLGDAGCAAAETRCLARLAVVSDARATLAAVPVDRDAARRSASRRDAVVVTAAGERRRVQSTETTLAADVAFALAAPAGAHLRLGFEDGVELDREPAPISFFIDDVPVAGPGEAVVVRPGEHRVLLRRGEQQARALVVVEAGESVWVSFSAHDLASPDQPAAVAVAVPDAGLPVGAVVGGAMVVVSTVAAAGMLGLAGAAVAAAEASDVQTTRAAQAVAANSWGAAAGAALAVAVVGAGITVWSLAGEVP